MTSAAGAASGSIGFMPRVTCVTILLFGFAMISTGGALADGRTAKIQEMLIWTGDYDGLVTGEVDSYTRSAVRSYLSRHGSRFSDTLTEPELNTLIREGEAARIRAGFTVLTDTRTGVAVGIPQALAPNRHDEQFVDLGVPGSIPGGGTIK
jgi:hypothetical protein